VRTVRHFRAEDRCKFCSLADTRASRGFLRRCGERRSVCTVARFLFTADAQPPKVTHKGDRATTLDYRPGHNKEVRTMRARREVLLASEGSQSRSWPLEDEDLFRVPALEATQPRRTRTRGASCRHDTLFTRNYAEIAKELRQIASRISLQTLSLR